MNTVSMKSLLWSQLSTEQMNNGVHPEELKILEFDLPEAELNMPKTIQQLNRFFLGCRAATSDSDFLSRSVRWFNSNEPSIVKIKTVIEQVLLIQMPIEEPLQIELCGSYPIFIRGEGYGDDDYKRKFAETYNGLIQQGQAYLMHPSREKELVVYLGDKFSDASLAAKRLTIYRCFGREELQVIEDSREYNRLSTQVDQLKTELSELSKKGPNLIMNPCDLQEDALSCIQDITVRKHVCLAYKELASKEQLSILNLPENELYTYEGGKEGKAHPDLVFAEKAYLEEPTTYNFLSVVSYLKMLCSSDLNKLEQAILKQKIDTLKAYMELIEWSVGMQDYFIKHLGILNRSIL